MGMARKLKILILIIFISVSWHKAIATHIYGGELLYTHLSGDDYQITLTLYGDCAGSAFNSLKGATPTINIFRDSRQHASYDLLENTALRSEVSAVCPEQEDSTTCKNPTYAIPGVTKFVYQRTVSLPPSRYWLIVFDGVLTAQTAAGRSNSITNTTISTVSPKIMRLEAMLNNLNAPNSSPQYTTTPTPYYCINVQQQYNQGASDSDNDSLVFNLIPAIQKGGQKIVYNNPYTSTEPLAASGFSFNYINGQMIFFPNRVQQSLVVDKVEEYRDTLLIGSTMREMTFIVLPSCSNNAPTSKLTANSISNGYIDGTNINVCNNSGPLSFSIQTSDVENNNITIKTRGEPLGSTTTINNNGSKSPTINFTWPLQNVKAGYYNIFVSHEDDNCPLTGNKTIAYTIHVIDSITISHEVIKETECEHLQHIRFNISKGLLPRSVSVYDLNNKLIRSYTDSIGVITDSFDVGTYTVLAKSDGLPCNTTYVFEVKDGGTYPHKPEYEQLHLCLHDPVAPLTPIAINSGQIKWYTIEGIELATPPTYNTEEVNIYSWLISQQIDVCESTLDTFTVSVHPFPQINIINGEGTLCYGDGIFLLAKGGIRYEWEPANLIKYRNDSAFTTVKEPTTYIVTGYSPYNCPSRDSVNYSNIEQCCTFSYPNAFTPNDDGSNDGWKPIVYGNVDSYLLSVYNRWGERVFISSDPNEHWRGTYAGKKADIGTYFYLLRANCTTGKEEVKSGEFILIR